MERLVKAGVGEFVVCGGARNAVLLEVLARMDGKVRVWSHFEERSAGFFAMGRTMETGRPCGVVVTSGTAVAELFPAVMEAFYQARPLVLVTADRPEEFRGSGAPQAVEQAGMFQSYAEQDVAKWEGKGPLHVNVELGEEFDPGADGFGELAIGDFQLDFGRPNVGSLSRWLREPTMKGMVVMVGCLEPDEKEEVFHFCEALDAPVVAEGTSGLREALQHLALVGPDGVLRSNPPSKILRLGGVPSGRFWRDLEEMPRVGVWSVSRNGLKGLAREAGVSRGDLGRILPALGDMEEIGDVSELLEDVQGHAMRIEEALEAFPDSEPGWMRTLSIFASVGSGVYLGNSLPIREWNDFAQWERPVPVVRANRGANGIDGQISAWLGASAGEENAWGIFGDLTALYDLAGLKMLSQVETRGRVMVVVNNGGGGIFGEVPRLSAMRPQAAGWMKAETPANFEAIATLWGMDFLRMKRVDEFDIPDSGEKPLLVEVLPDPAQTGGFRRMLGKP